MGKKRVATIKGTEVKESADKKKRKKKKILQRGRIFIKASYNNTSVSATDADGNVIAWSSAGAAGFKGPRKATPYAASKVVDLFLGKLEKVDMKEIDLYITGIGAGRFSAIRALTSKGLNIVSINDTTPVPHNGCKPPKPRRV